MSGEEEKSHMLDADESHMLMLNICADNLAKKCWRLSCNRLHLTWKVHNELQAAIRLGTGYEPTPAVQRERQRVKKNEQFGPESICLRFKNSKCFDPFCRMPHPNKPEGIELEDIITLKITAGNNAKQAFIRGALKGEELNDTPDIPFRYILRCHRLTPTVEIERHMNERLVSK